VRQFSCCNAKKQSTETLSTLTPPLIITPKQFILALADSGSTDFLLRQSHLPTQLHPHGDPIRVQLPNGSFVTSVGFVNFIIPHSSIAITAHIFPDHLLDHNLASMSKLCAQGCSATFNSTSVVVRDAEGKIVLSGTKELSDTLWHLPIPLAVAAHPCVRTPPPAIPSASLAIHHQLDADFVQFFHATMGSPCVSTLCTAVQRGYLRSFPRITAKMIRANPPNSIATALGHLDRQRQGINSTKPSTPLPPVSNVPFSSSFSPQSIGESTTDDEVHGSSDDNTVYTMLVKTDEVNSSDLTGRFPVTSRRGTAYLHVSTWRG